jgi:hypothetical protein
VDNRETELSTGRCGGRGGTPPFPVKDRRTWGTNARTSTSGQGRSDFHTWIGRRGGGACCRRQGRAWATPMRGGSGWGKSSEGNGRGWTRSSWGARGGGEEALGSRNWVGMVRLRRIPVGNQRRRFGVGGGSSGKTALGKRAWSTFIAPHDRRKKEEGRERSRNRTQSGGRRRCT